MMNINHSGADIPWYMLNHMERACVARPRKLRAARGDLPRNEVVAATTWPALSVEISRSDGDTP